MLEVRRTGSSVVFNLSQAGEVSSCKRGWSCTSYHAWCKQDCSRTDGRLMDNCYAEAQMKDWIVISWNNQGIFTIFCVEPLVTR